MDAQVIAGLNSLNTSIQNAAQLASAAGDSKRAEQMHWEDIKWTDKWRHEDKDFARENNRQAYEWTKEFANMDYEHQKEFIEMAQRYNSPLEQVKMLREAGLNPALAFGDHSSVGVGGSGSHSSPSLSFPSSLGMPSQSGYFRAPNLGDPAQSFAAIASAYQAISQSKKSDVETTQLENSAEALLRKITAEADFAEIGVVLENEFGRGDRSRSQRIADQKIAETVFSIKNLAKQGDYIEAQTAVERVEKLIKDNELDRSNIELQYLPEQLRATIQGIRASAHRDYQQGELNKQLGVTEDHLREVRKNLLGSQQKQAENAASELAELARKYYIENGTFPNEMNWLEIQKNYLQQIREDLKSKEFDNTWTGRFMRLLGIPAAAVSSATIRAAGK